MVTSTFQLQFATMCTFQMQLTVKRNGQKYGTNFQNMFLLQIYILRSFESVLAKVTPFECSYKTLN